MVAAKFISGVHYSITEEFEDAEMAEIRKAAGDTTTTIFKSSYHFFDSFGWCPDEKCGKSNPQQLKETIDS